MAPDVMQRLNPAQRRADLRIDLVGVVGVHHQYRIQAVTGQDREQFVGDALGQDHRQAAVQAQALQVWDRGQVMLAYEHVDRDNLSGDDRSFFTGDQRGSGGRDYRTTRCNPGTMDSEIWRNCFISHETETKLDRGLAFTDERMRFHRAARRIERRGPVSEVAQFDVRRQRERARGECPDVQVVHVVHAFHAQHGLAHGLDVHVAGDRLQKHIDRFTQQTIGAVHHHPGEQEKAITCSGVTAYRRAGSRGSGTSCRTWIKSQRCG